MNVYKYNKYIKKIIFILILFILILFILILFIFLNNYLKKNLEMFQKTPSGLLCGDKKDICRINQYGKSSCCGDLKCRLPYGKFQDKICMDKNDKSFIDNMLNINTLEEESNFYDFNLPNGGIIHLPNGSIINIPELKPFKLPNNSIIIVLPTSGIKIDLPNAPNINIANLPNINLPKGSIISIENNIGIENIPKIIPSGTLININNKFNNLFNIKFNTKINVGDYSNINLPDINLPDINLPDINLPDINLPNVKLPDINLKDFYLVDTIPIDTSFFTIDFWKNIFNINVCGKKKIA